MPRLVWLTTTTQKSINELDAILTDVAQLCCQAVNATSVRISTTNPDSETMTVIAEYNSPQHIQDDAGSVLVVPLLAEDEAIGCIEVRENRRKRDFTDDETQIVRLAAAQVSQTIQNARLQQALDESRAQAARNEARFRALFEQSNDAVFIADLQGIGLNANQHAANMLGYDLEEMSGLTYRDVVAPSELSQKARMP